VRSEKTTDDFNPQTKHPVAESRSKFIYDKVTTTTDIVSNMHNYTKDHHNYMKKVSNIDKRIYSWLNILYRSTKCGKMFEKDSLFNGLRLQYYH
jgi:hypothetical protein